MAESSADKASDLELDFIGLALNLFCCLWGVGGIDVSHENL